MPEALDAGRRAVALYEQLGEPGPLAEVLVTLALGHWALVQMPECQATAERAVAVAVLQPGGTVPSTPTRWPSSAACSRRRPGREALAVGDAALAWPDGWARLH